MKISSQIKLETFETEQSDHRTANSKFVTPPNFLKRNMKEA